MLSTGHMSKYWAFTAIAFCAFYAVFHLSNSEILSLIPKSPGYDQGVEAPRTRLDMDTDEGRHLAQALQSTFTPSQSYPARFPRTIWQAWLGPDEHGHEKFAERTETWKKVKGFEHKILHEADALTFIEEHFASRSSIVNFWKELNTTVLKADFLRYLIMLAVGGVYSDIDTSNLVHPDRWIPIDLGASTINAIIGIEYDDHTYKMFIRPIGLCQWTLMSKPGHPIFETAVQRVMSNLEYIARRKRVTLGELTLDKIETLEATGPGMITDAVMQVLNDQGQNVTWATLHDQREPKLYGDVLVLPINGFAGHQKHSHAGDPAYGERYIQHHFARTWYAPDRGGGPADGKKDNNEGEQKSKSKPEETAEKKVDVKHDAKSEKDGAA